MSAGLALHAVGFRRPLFQEQLSFSFEKYGLYGYATALRLAAARSLAEAAAVGAERNRGAARVAADASADDFACAARLLALQGSHQEAITALRHARRLAWWRTDVRAKLLEAQIEQGDKTAARRLTDLAYRKGDPEAQFVLAKTHLRHDRRDDAAGCMKQALAATPDHFELRLALAHYFTSFGARSYAIEHAQAAQRLARDIGERLQAAELLRVAGEDVPARSDILWLHFLTEYSPTALVLLAYLLVLVSPWLSCRIRSGQQRLGAWFAEQQPAGDEPPPHR